MAESRTPIFNGEDDIAYTVKKERMRVQFDGRVPLQKFYLWATEHPGDNQEELDALEIEKTDEASKTTNTPYNPRDDGPQHGGTKKMLTNKETVSGPETTEYIEVGIICGDNPKKYSGEGNQQSRSRARDDAQKDRGILDRDRSAMRVFTPTTEYISTSGAKFYVGCRLMQGRFFPRIISADCIFFYDEFWDSDPMEMVQKERTTHPTKNARTLAARKNTSDPHTVVTLTLDEAEKAALSHPLATTVSEDLAARLYVQIELFNKEKNSKYLEAAKSLIEQADPSLKFGPHTVDDGLAAFCEILDGVEQDEQVEFTLMEASKMSDELQRAHPHLAKFGPALIVKLHTALNENEGKGRLTRSSIPFFLDFCAKKVDVETDVKETAAWVEHGLDAVESHNANIPTMCMTLPDETEMKTASFRRILACMRDSLQAHVNALEKGCLNVGEQFGALMKGVNLSTLGNGMTTVTDLSAAQAVITNLASVTASQVAVQESVVVKAMRDTIKMCDTVIGVYGDGDDDDDLMHK